MAYDGFKRISERTRAGSDSRPVASGWRALQLMRRVVMRHAVAVAELKAIAVAQTKMIGWFGEWASRRHHRSPVIEASG